MKESKLWRGLHRPNIAAAEADFIIQGISFDEGCSQRMGAAQAPDYLRKMSDRHPPVTEAGKVIEADIYDGGNLNPRPEEGQEDFFERVAGRATEILALSKPDASPFPIFLGGDHSITIPILKSIQKVYGDMLEGVAIIHIDSHLDLCDELDGNPLSHGSTHRRGWELELFTPEETYFVGTRSMEEQELKFLEGKNSNIYRAREISRRGAEYVAAEIINSIDVDRAYLTLDIDVLDPAFAPGTGTPVAAGPDTGQVWTLLKEFSSLSLLGMDLVEVSPPWDNSEITSYAARHLLFSMIGFLTPRDKKKTPLH